MLFSVTFFPFWRSKPISKTKMKEFINSRTTKDNSPSLSATNSIRLPGQKKPLWYSALAKSRLLQLKIVCTIADQGSKKSTSFSNMSICMLLYLFVSHITFIKYQCIGSWILDESSSSQWCCKTVSPCPLRRPDFSRRSSRPPRDFLAGSSLGTLRLLKTAWCWGGPPPVVWHPRNGQPLH